MTITGWVLFALFAFIVGAFAVGGFMMFDSVAAKSISVIVGVILIFALLFGMFWYFDNTASGQRALLDQKSDFNNGIERTVTVYTANGEVIAQYTGKIDIDTNDGGYVKFDFEGKRYIYYNCFIETIAEIE
jgi:Ni,Fe-hydrogenase I cytochrome b subunit